MAEFGNNVGPYQVEAGGVNLGLISGGLNISYAVEAFDSVADVSGDTARGKWVTAQRAGMAGAITEAQYAQLQLITGGVLESSTEVNIFNCVGEDLLDSAVELIAKPFVKVAGVVAVSTDPKDWWIIPTASLMAEFAVVAGPLAQKLWNWTATGVPVRQADLDSGGHLYNSGTPEYSLGQILRIGGDPS